MKLYNDRTMVTSAIGSNYTDHNNIIMPGMTWLVLSDSLEARSQQVGSHP